METLLTLLCLFLGLEYLEFCSCSPIDLQSTVDGVQWELNTSLIGLLVAACIIIVVAGCLCCQPRKGFREFRDSSVSVTNLDRDIEHGVAATNDPGLVNSIAEQRDGINSAAATEFTIFTPIATPSPHHNNNNVLVTTQPTLSAANYRKTYPQVQTVSPTAKRITEANTCESIDDVSDWFGESQADFPRAKLKYLRELGRGWFGKVIEGEAQCLCPQSSDSTVSSDTSRLVVVRMLDSMAGSRERAAFLRDARLYRIARHAHVIALLGRCLESPPLLLLQEHCSRGDLKQYLKEAAVKSFPDVVSNTSGKTVCTTYNDLLRMCYELTDALVYLHHKEVAYHDLAARNCQLTSDLSIRIGDYGLSAQRYPNDYYPGSPPVPVRWCAPESVVFTDTTLQPLQVTQESNVWSLGVTLWEVGSWGAQPYADLTDDEVVSQVLGPPHIRLQEPVFTLPYTQHLYHLTQLCCQPREVRPHVTQVHSMLLHLLEAYQTKPVQNSERNGVSNAHKPVSDSEFLARWDALKPNTIVKTDNHTLPHVPKPAMDAQSELSSCDMDGSMSPNLSIAESASEFMGEGVKSPSLTNLHGSFENLNDVVNQAYKNEDESVTESGLEPSEITHETKLKQSSTDTVEKEVSTLESGYKSDTTESAADINIFTKSKKESQESTTDDEQKDLLVDPVKLTDTRESLIKTLNEETNLGVFPREEQLESWLENVAQTAEDMQYVQGLSQAMKELDRALAQEQTSSSDSSHQPSPAPESLTTEQKFSIKNIKKLAARSMDNETVIENKALDFRLGPINQPMSNVVDASESDSLLDSILMSRKIDSSSETEDETWKKRIERGAYSEKVRQKSKSVADLMVLTHIDTDTDSETPLNSLEYKVFKSNLDTSNKLFGSEGNIAANTVHDKFQEELKKLHEARRDSLLFVPQSKSENARNIQEENCVDKSSSHEDKKEIATRNNIESLDENITDVYVENRTDNQLYKIVGISAMSDDFGSEIVSNDAEISDDCLEGFKNAGGSIHSGDFNTPSQNADMNLQNDTNLFLKAGLDEVSETKEINLTQGHINDSVRHLPIISVTEVESNENVESEQEVAIELYKPVEKKLRFFRLVSQDSSSDEGEKDAVGKHNFESSQDTQLNNTVDVTNKLLDNERLQQTILLNDNEENKRCKKLSSEMEKNESQMELNSQNNKDIDLKLSSCTNESDLDLKIDDELTNNAIKNLTDSLDKQNISEPFSKARTEYETVEDFIKELEESAVNFVISRGFVTKTPPSDVPNEKLNFNDSFICILSENQADNIKIEKGNLSISDSKDDTKKCIFLEENLESPIRRNDNINCLAASTPFIKKTGSSSLNTSFSDSEDVSITDDIFTQIVDKTTISKEGTDAVSTHNPVENAGGEKLIDNIPTENTITPLIWNTDPNVFIDKNSQHFNVMRCEVIPDFKNFPVLSEKNYFSENKNLSKNQNCDKTSVILGPCDEYTLDLYSGLKTTYGKLETEPSEEELLQFSSNFTDLNIEIKNQNKGKMPTVPEIKDASDNFFKNEKQMCLNFNGHHSETENEIKDLRIEPPSPFRNTNKNNQIISESRNICDTKKIDETKNDSDDNIYPNITKVQMTNMDSQVEDSNLNVSDIKSEEQTVWTVNFSLDSWDQFLGKSLQEHNDSVNNCDVIFGVPSLKTLAQECIDISLTSCDSLETNCLERTVSHTTDTSKTENDTVILAKTFVRDKSTTESAVSLTSPTLVSLESEQMLIGDEFPLEKKSELESIGSPQYDSLEYNPQTYDIVSENDMPTSASTEMDKTFVIQSNLVKESASSDAIGASTKITKNTLKRNFSAGDIDKMNSLNDSTWSDTNPFNDECELSYDNEAFDGLNNETFELDNNDVAKKYDNVFEIPNALDGANSKYSYSGASGDWDNASGWFLHPQQQSGDGAVASCSGLSADDLSGQLDSPPVSDNSYVGFSLDEECMTALRNELAAKLPHAQGPSLDSEQEEWGIVDPMGQTEQHDEIILKYNVYATHLSPIAEEESGGEDQLDEITPQYKLPIRQDDSSDTDCDWSEQLQDTDTRTQRAEDDDGQSSPAEGAGHRSSRHRHTPSMDSCCSNDTLFNLEDLNGTVCETDPVKLGVQEQEIINRESKIRDIKEEDRISLTNLEDQNSNGDRKFDQDTTTSTSFTMEIENIPYPSINGCESLESDTEIIDIKPPDFISENTGNAIFTKPNSEDIDKSDRTVVDSKIKIERSKLTESKPKEDASMLSKNEKLDRKLNNSIVTNNLEDLDGKIDNLQENSPPHSPEETYTLQDILTHLNETSPSVQDNEFFPDNKNCENSQDCNENNNCEEEIDTENVTQADLLNKSKVLIETPNEKNDCSQNADIFDVNFEFTKTLPDPNGTINCIESAPTISNRIVCSLSENTLCLPNSIGIVKSHSDSDIKSGCSMTLKNISQQFEQVDSCSMTKKFLLNEQQFNSNYSEEKHSTPVKNDLSLNLKPHSNSSTAPLPSPEDIPWRQLPASQLFYAQVAMQEPVGITGTANGLYSSNTSCNKNEERRSEGETKAECEAKKDCKEKEEREIKTDGACEVKNNKGNLNVADKSCIYENLVVETINDTVSENCKINTNSIYENVNETNNDYLKSSDDSDNSEKREISFYENIIVQPSAENESGNPGREIFFDSEESFYDDFEKLHADKLKLYDNIDNLEELPVYDTVAEEKKIVLFNSSKIDSSHMYDSVAEDSISDKERSESSKSTLYDKSPSDKSNSYETIDKSNTYENIDKTLEKTHTYETLDKKSLLENSNSFEDSDKTIDVKENEGIYDSVSEDLMDKPDSDTIYDNLQNCTDIAADNTDNSVSETTICNESTDDTKNNAVDQTEHTYNDVNETIIDDSTVKDSDNNVDNAAYDEVNELKYVKSQIDLNTTDSEDEGSYYRDDEDTYDRVYTSEGDLYSDLTDIRFSGPADAQLMSTSFSDATPHLDDQEWDSGSDSRSSSSGEFVWKDGEREAAVRVLQAPPSEEPTQSEGGASQMDTINEEGSCSGTESSSGDDDEEGETMEFIPSAWDSQATPMKSAMRSPSKSKSEKKIRNVWFKKQKYHCIYEYPREPEPEMSPTWTQPCSSSGLWGTSTANDLSNFTDWELDTETVLDDQSSISGDGELDDTTGVPCSRYPRRDYYQRPGDLYRLADASDFEFTASTTSVTDDDFYISSTARPFQTYGLTSQFFPGQRHGIASAQSSANRAASILDFANDLKKLHSVNLMTTADKTLQSQDSVVGHATPDSGVEDITPGSVCDNSEFTDNQFSDVTDGKDSNAECIESLKTLAENALKKTKKRPANLEKLESPSKTQDVMGGLRHTRDRLKLDLPPSPSAFTASKIFNIENTVPSASGVVMTSTATTVPSSTRDKKPTFTTFGKTRFSIKHVDTPTDETVEEFTVPSLSTKAIAVITTETNVVANVSSPDASQKSESSEQENGLESASANNASRRKSIEVVRGEASLLDSADEDSGIESSTNATLERRTTMKS